MELYVPIIKEVFNKVISKKNIDLLDDKRVRLFFKTSYPLLPLPLRLLVNEKDFVRFCLNKKHLLIPTVKQKEKIAAPKKVAAKKIATKKVITNKNTIKKTNTKTK